MSSVSFIGIGLQVEGASQLALSTVRVRFTQDPLLVSASGAHDGLNPANYALAGPGAPVITACMAVYGDTQSVDLFLLAPLAAGAWTVTVSNVQTAGGNTLGSPNSATFTATGIGQTTPLNQGASSMSSYDVLRRHLNPAFQGAAWTGLLEAFAVGDDINKQNAALVFDQLFTSTASGTYLTRRVADVGIQKPADIGMPDEVFREYAIALSTNKLTESAFLEVLEVFYGPDTVRARAETVAIEPFALSDGDDLEVLLDERDAVQIIFSVDDANIIGLAKGAEVAAALTRGLRAAGSKAYALPFTDPTTGITTVRLYSGSRGLSSSVRVTGGKAQGALQFPTQLPITSGLLPTWTVTVNTVAGTTRFTCGVGVDLSQLRVGDYVNVFGSAFNAANRGSFPVTAVSYSYPGGVLSQYFEVVLAGSAQTVTQLTQQDVLYFRPTKETPYTSSARAVIVSVPGEECDITMPATSAAVGRQLLKAAYLHQTALKSVTSCVRDLTGAVTVVAPSHGMAVGDSFFLDGVTNSYAVPPTTAGNLTTLTSYGVMSTWSQITPPNVGRHWTGMTKLNDGRVLIAGGIRTGVATASSQMDIFTVTSTIPQGLATQYGVTLANDAGLGTTYMMCSLVTLKSPSAGGKALIMAGTDNAGTFNATSNLYTPGAIGSPGSFSGGVAMNNAVAGRGVCQRSDFFVMAIGGGNGTTATANVEVYNPTTNTWAAKAAMNVARCQPGCVQLNDGTVLAVGGRKSYTRLDYSSLADLGTITNTAEVYSVGGNTWSYVGSMSCARVGHATILLSDGRVLVVGGAGYNPTQSTTVAYLNSTEIYDPVHQTWSPGPSMRSGRAFFASDVLNNKLYVAGGNTTDTSCEILDLKTMRWSLCAGVLDAPQPKTQGIFTGSLFVQQYAPNAGLTDDTKLHLLTPGADSFVAGGLNGLHTVTAVVDQNTFKFQTLAMPYYTATTGGTITRAAAPVDPDIPGPYAYDPNAGVATTASETTLSAAVYRGHSYAQLSVGDATVFPDAIGYVVLAWGTKSQVGPVKYLGRVSSTAIALDFGYVFPSDVAAGAKVTWLSQRGPWVPEHPEQVGSFYLTASPAGRVAAQAAVAAVAAAALEPTVTITYPGDRGLGGEGRPTSGAQKLSDVVAVFAGADVDAEVASARLE